MNKCEFNITSIFNYLLLPINLRNHILIIQIYNFKHNIIWFSSLSLNNLQNMYLNIEYFDSIFIFQTCWINHYFIKLNILYTSCDTSLSSLLKLVLIGLSLISSKTTRFVSVLYSYMSFQTVLLLPPSFLHYKLTERI